MPGAAHLVLADGVVHLDPEPAVLEAMLEGWALQQRTRFLNWESTIRPGSRWSVGWPTSPTSTRGNGTPPRWMPSSTTFVPGALAGRWRCRPHGTTRTTYGCSSTTSPILATAGRPRATNDSAGLGQLLHEWNTITHTSEYEGAAERRPLTYDEVQTLFDAADGVAVPRAGARSPSRSHLPHFEAPSTRHRAPRRPQQRASRAGHRPAGIRPRRLHRHQHQQRHPLDRIRQTRLARLHRVPHTDLTAPKNGGSWSSETTTRWGRHLASAHSSTNTQSRRMRLKKEGLGSVLGCM